MADNKQYYYMRLKENFFDSNEITILESLQDGYLYSNILLKLYLRSLRDNGRLMFNNTIPYNAQMIATITRHQVGTVERALNIFKEMGLVEILDSGAIYMMDIQNYIGQTSTEADRKREYRSRIEAEKIAAKMSKDKCPDKSPPEIELERETEKESEYITSFAAMPTLSETIKLFFDRYEAETGNPHERISQQKADEISARLNEYGVDAEHIEDFMDEYFDGQYHKGLCGDSDKSIFHFSSPIVLNLLTARVAGSPYIHDDLPNT